MGIYETFLPYQQIRDLEEDVQYEWDEKKLGANMLHEKSNGQGRGERKHLRNIQFWIKEYNHHTEMSHNLFKLQCGTKDKISKNKMHSE